MSKGPETVVTTCAKALVRCVVLSIAVPFIQLGLALATMRGALFTGEVQ